MEIDNFKCAICGEGEATLNVHHLFYDKNRNYWDYEDHQLITLCEDCHKAAHCFDESFHDIIIELKRKGISSIELYNLLHGLSVDLYRNPDNAITENIGEGSGAFLVPENATLESRRNKVKNRK